MQLIHNSFLLNGYVYQSAKELESFKLPRLSFGGAYVKRYKTALGDFLICVAVQREDFSTLPLLFVLEKPEPLRNVLLPHISVANTLCIANEFSGDWHPYNILNTVQLIDQRISLTLEHSVRGYLEGKSDYSHEFSNYWWADVTAYGLIDPGLRPEKKLLYKAVLVPIGSQKIDSRELFVYDDAAHAEKWLKIRGGKWSATEGAVSWVRLKPIQKPPVDWPPSSLKDILNWLKATEAAAHDQLIRLLISSMHKSKHLIALDVSGDGLICCEVVFTARVIELLKHQTKRKSGRCQPIKISSIAPVLKSKQCIELFKRVSYRPVTDSTILQRNRPSPQDLSNKRILLIGAGTIGGYLSELLVKVGAGTGSRGVLDISDPDEFKPENIGRHWLNAHYIGWNKAEAIVAKLSECSMPNIQLRFLSRVIRVCSADLGGYDLIIDATGHAPFSKMLAHFLHQNRMVYAPFVIHAHNGGYGQTSVVFIDNGKACYGCIEHLDVFKKGQKPLNPRRTSCGATYTPYDANISQITASLTQQAVLNTLQLKLPWTYVQYSSGDALQHKKQKLAPDKQCRINRHVG